jgi:hypothetical protein
VLPDVIVGMSASANGEILCTTSLDKTLKVFDIMNFGSFSHCDSMSIHTDALTCPCFTDMTNMIKLPFVPGPNALIHSESVGLGVVAMCDPASCSSLPCVF